MAFLRNDLLDVTVDFKKKAHAICVLFRPKLALVNNEKQEHAGDVVCFWSQTWVPFFVVYFGDHRNGPVKWLISTDR